MGLSRADYDSDDGGCDDNEYRSVFNSYQFYFLQPAESLPMFCQSNVLLFCCQQQHQ